MTDLETTNPTTDNNENTNTIINPENLDTNLWATSPEEQNGSDFSNIFSENENSSEKDLAPEAPELEPINSAENSEAIETTEEIKQESTAQEPSPNNIPEENTIEQDDLPKDLNPSTPEEEKNHEIVLWKFDNAMLNTIENWKNSSTLDNSLLEHPAILDNSPIMKVNTEDHEKAKLVQKEKLAQLIKVHESKAQKTWFTKWILSGVVLTIAIMAASFIFAKDQILNLLDPENKENIPLPASIVDLNYNSEIDEEAIDEETIDEEAIDEEAIDEETIDEEAIDEEALDEETIDEEAVDEEAIDEETIDEEAVDEEAIDEEALDEENESNQNEISENHYNIIHVSSEEDANWVLPSHCSDLTCYGIDKEFTPCTTFRLAENLDENANRIGNNWVCRYKDSSELVYVEF